MDDLSHKTLFRQSDDVQAVALTAQQFCLEINQSVSRPDQEIMNWKLLIALRVLKARRCIMFKSPGCSCDECIDFSTPSLTYINAFTN